MEAHDLAPLNKRLTPAQLQRRREKMHRRGIGRIDLERNLQQFTKGTVGAFQAQGNQINTLVGKFTWYLRYTWIAVGFISIWLGALTGHLLGWW